MKTRSAPSYPSPGQMFPDFTLPTEGGERIRISDYRGRRNLVMVFAQDFSRKPARELLRDLAVRRGEFLQEETQVLVIARWPVPVGSREGTDFPLQFPLLIDSQGKILIAVGAIEPSPHAEERGRNRLVLYVTDRYGEVYAAARAAEGGRIPTADELLDWVRYIDLQCPE